MGYMVFIKQQNNVRSGTMIYYFLKIINIVLPFLSQGLINHHIHQWGCLAQTCDVQSDADSPEKSTWRNKHFKIQNCLTCPWYYMYMIVPSYTVVHIWLLPHSKQGFLLKHLSHLAPVIFWMKICASCRSIGCRWTWMSWGLDMW